MYMKLDSRYAFVSEASGMPVSEQNLTLNATIPQNFYESEAEKTFLEVVEEVVKVIVYGSVIWMGILQLIAS